MKRFNLLVLLFAALLANAQWSFDTLHSSAATLWGGTAGTKAVFTDGNEWNVFGVETGTHTYGTLSISRSMIQVVENGDDIYFGGGKYGYFADPQYTKNVDVYDASADTWETLTLSKNREVGGAGTVGGKIFFAGGTGRSDISGPVYMYNTVDIFDAVTDVRTTAKLKKARSNISVGAAGNKIVFAGGWYWDAYYNVKTSNIADVYDVTTGIWLKTKISKARESMGVAVVDSKIIFAGGSGNAGALKNVDIYNTATGTWSTSTMSFADYGMQSVVLDGNAYFANGFYSGNKIQRFDPATNTWSVITLPVNVNKFEMEVIDNKIFCAGGYDVVSNTYTDLVQIYDPAALTWSYDYLSLARTVAGSTVAGNVAVFAGGIVGYVYPTYISSNQVDFYAAPMRLGVTDTYVAPEKTDVEMQLFPNPVTDAFTIMLPETFTLPVVCNIFNVHGQLVQSVQLSEMPTRIHIGDLTAGQYLIQVINADKNLRSERIIIKR